MYFADTGILQILAQVSSGRIIWKYYCLTIKAKGNIAYYQRETGQEIDFVINESRG